MYLNTVYESSSRNCTYRVVFQDVSTLWLFDIYNLPNWPQVIELKVFKEELSSGKLVVINEPFPLDMVEDDTVQMRKRDEAYAALTPLLQSPYEMMFKASRNRLIKQAIDQSGKKRIYIVRQLQRYWQRGMSPNALIPDYKNSGGKGKSRENAKHKLGRRRTTASGEGINVTKDIEDIFELAIVSKYIPNQKLPFQDAYLIMVGLFKSRYPLVHKYDIPTEGQFRYFFDKNYNKAHVTKKRMPRKLYDNDIKALTSSSAYMNIGPGGRYEIDATIADLYLVSENDPEKIVGRPTIYFVKDVFSRMIVGMYVGLERPSWVSAMMAMSNAFLSKVDYCKSYGIEISDVDWPSIGVPFSIMADRGELYRHQADVLADVFNIQISNSRAYLGSDKGGVERLFNTIQAKFRPYVDGIVEPVNGKKRLGRRYELDAELSLRAFTEIVIHIVLHYNNKHVITDYDFAEDIPEDIPAIPVELWNWGVKNRTGRLRNIPSEQVLVNLLPSGKATSSENGIKFKGLLYSSKELLRQGYFDRISGTEREQQLDVRYDPRFVDKIYLCHGSSLDDFWVLNLSVKSRRYAGLTFAAASPMIKQARIIETQAEQESTYYAPDLIEEIEAISKREADKKPAVSDKTKSERLRNIQKNREEELGQERGKTIIGKQSQASDQAEVIDITTKRSASKPSHSIPSPEEFFDDDE